MVSSVEGYRCSGRMMAAVGAMWIWAPVPEPVALRIVAQLAEALAGCRCGGGVQRDVKPGNVLPDDPAGDRDGNGEDAPPQVRLADIEGIEAQELEADLVLGGDDGKECTYASGYLKRQASFYCLICVPDGVAGVCTACSLACHDGHEIVELWTKRMLRCDCGNSKFCGRLCKLCPQKDSENPANSYNQNFKGSYCTCGRPYPDPEAKEQIEMIQYCICEDWFHEDHVGLNYVEEIKSSTMGCNMV